MRVSTLVPRSDAGGTLRTPTPFWETDLASALLQTAKKVQAQKGVSCVLQLPATKSSLFKSHPRPSALVVSVLARRPRITLVFCNSLNFSLSELAMATRDLPIERTRCVVLRGLMQPPSPGK